MFLQVSEVVIRRISWIIDSTTKRWRLETETILLDQLFRDLCLIKY